MIKAIRDTEKALGDGEKKLTNEEEEIKRMVRRSIIAKVDIPMGAMITEDMLDFKRPGIGLEPKNIDKILGRKAKIRIRSDEPITFDKLS
jgi:N-acetylneuraminate synthase/N,N'-diacetyllegionaminate synthase